MSDKLEEKIDRVIEQVSEIKEVLTAQHAVLVDHTRRSTASEKRIEIIEKELAPIRFKAQMQTIILKAIIGSVAFIGTIVGILVGLRHLGVL